MSLVKNLNIAIAVPHLARPWSSYADDQQTIAIQKVIEMAKDIYGITMNIKSAKNYLVAVPLQKRKYERRALNKQKCAAGIPVLVGRLRKNKKKHTSRTRGDSTEDDEDGKRERDRSNPQQMEFQPVSETPQPIFRRPKPLSQQSADILIRTDRKQPEDRLGKGWGDVRLIPQLTSSEPDGKSPVQKVGRPTATPEPPKKLIAIDIDDTPTPMPADVALPNGSTKEKTLSQKKFFITADFSETEKEQLSQLISSNGG
ncbi:hypothetical protein EX30DRAFT_372090 [Ascodesmis nigricans]|uniref:BRCT domain-containing protein n=1 Tax=Ascodesmis nigricans TaxID=341454 RepID=A0A4S2MVW0_9PEZI|nr:hypothetical protein EX30DRAFT_372090 [Ascodesmis nigricans]